ncbi:MAG TPA: methyltransferase [Rhizobiaceae bacterium]|nr:methyltransferase [Rhizobiaceae bacterium]
MTIAPDHAARREFILANTSPIAPPHVPEIRLHLAHEAHYLWLRTEKELDEIGLEPPFWAFAWAGGQGLARHVLDLRELVRGKRVLDFASGSGIVAIAAALAGASQVTACDIDPFCAAAVELNAAANGVAIAFIAEDLTSRPLEHNAFDIILAGDVFYDSAMTQRIVPWFEAARSAGCTILAGDPGRSYLPQSKLKPLAVYEVPVTRALEDSEVKRTTVWEFEG